MAFVLLAGLTGALTGCIGTADDRSTMGVPFIKDNVLGQYERPSGELFEAAKSVLSTNGKLIAENTINHSLEARVNKIHVWVRVLEVDPKLSALKCKPVLGLVALIWNSPTTWKSKSPSSWCTKNLRHGSRPWL